MSSKSDAQAQELVDRAQVAQQQGDAELAESLLKEAVRVSPGSAENYRGLAQLHMERRDIDGAVEHLRRSLQADPNDPLTHFHLAQVLFHRGEYDEADSSLSKVLQLDPSHGAALMLKGALAERQGRGQVALAAYHQVLAAEPDNVEARLRVAGIHLRSEKPENAAHVLRSICQCPYATQQEKCDAQWRLGKAYGRQERWSKAAESISAALKTKPQPTADDWYELADAWYRAGDPHQAHTAIRHALELEPQHANSIALAQHLTGPVRTPAQADVIQHAEHQAKRIKNR